MKSMTNRINCDDAKAESAAFVCVLSCRVNLPWEGERPREPHEGGSVI